MKKWYVGVDIGGTTIKLAFIDTMGNIMNKWEIPTNIHDNGLHIVPDIWNSILNKLSELHEKKELLLGIGVGAPGFINMDTGFIYQAINIGWYNYPLREELEKISGIPVKVDNDANLAGAGELWTGSAKGMNDVLFVTLGTGVGGGIIIDGKIVHGKLGMGGEVGHITADYDEKFKCNCGKKGCLETLVSATGIVRLTMEKLEKYPKSVLHDTISGNQSLTTKIIFDAYKIQDALAVDVVYDVSKYLGIAIANLANILNPECIVIGGGVSKAGDLLLTPVKTVFQKHALPRIKENTDIRIASLGNDAGVIGCAWLIKNSLK
ncbi:ROK family glucokinase [Bacillus cereus group sp. TH152-1LC]|uniref:ROK family glucokinase n=1 Tax=Bacillus cereus group sp. TH152-1LC TaxID=3018060 RepID=UPI0022E34A61|nr:ROK family glucokinase [Bacillus cereus group sp. TH152-1LC]MDA1675442.1 ROK family glucokinase [Bacillus cereus group sp. TH152-1LC]